MSIKTFIFRFLFLSFLVGAGYLAEKQLQPFLNVNPHVEVETNLADQSLRIVLLGGSISAVGNLPTYLQFYLQQYVPNKKVQVIPYPVIGLKSVWATALIPYLWKKYHPHLFLLLVGVDEQTEAVLLGDKEHSVAPTEFPLPPGLVEQSSVEQEKSPLAMEAIISDFINDEKHLSEKKEWATLMSFLTQDGLRLIFKNELKKKLGEISSADRGLSKFHQTLLFYFLLTKSSVLKAEPTIFKSSAELFWQVDRYEALLTEALRQAGQCELSKFLHMDNFDHAAELILLCSNVAPCLKTEKDARTCFLQQENIVPFPLPLLGFGAFTFDLKKNELPGFQNRLGKLISDSATIKHLMNHLEQSTNPVENSSTVILGFRLNTFFKNHSLKEPFSQRIKETVRVVNSLGSKIALLQYPNTEQEFISAAAAQAGIRAIGHRNTFATKFKTDDYSTFFADAIQFDEVEADRSQFTGHLTETGAKLYSESIAKNIFELFPDAWKK